MAVLMDYLRPGYPKQSVDVNSSRWTYVFRGPTATLAPLRPAANSGFDSHGLVERTTIEELDNPDFCEITVETVQTFALTTAAITDDQFPYWEIDQVQIEKNLRQHPAFIGFTAAEWIAIDAWDQELDNAQRQVFSYWVRDKQGDPVGSPITLTGTTTTGPKGFAVLRLLGVESFLDFAPVVRKTSKYRGSTAPSSADAGQKVTAPTYAPSGYEWLKTADRVSKTGSRSNEWTRQEEWTGARKVLLDKDELFTT